MTRVTLRTDGKGCITVAFPYDPGLVQKIKTVKGRRWHPEGRHWTVPHQPRAWPRRIYGDSAALWIDCCRTRGEERVNSVEELVEESGTDLPPVMGETAIAGMGGNAHHGRKNRVV